MRRAGAVYRLFIRFAYAQRFSIVLVFAIIGYASAAHAQDPSQFFDLKSPGIFSLRLFGTGYRWRSTELRIRESNSIRRSLKTSRWSAG